MINIEQKATDIHSWLQSACADMAESQTVLGFDVTADDIYNDEDSLRSLIGDRIYDEGGGNMDVAVEIARKLKSMTGNEALKRACSGFIVDYQ